MPISRSNQKLSSTIFSFVTLALFVLGCSTSSLAFGQSASTPTTINISETAKLTNARRLGMNLGNQTFYDSGQLLRNIAFKNPGFEGESWQSIIHCKYVTATSCTDDNIYSGWPANFFAGATAETILGKATGTTSNVTSSTVANFAAGTGVTVQLASPSVAPNVGDYLVVRMHIAGNAQSGWWTQVDPGVTLSTEFNDLSPNTTGKQALRVTVPSGAQATVASYMDGIAGRSFLQLNGNYTVTFRAKSTGGPASLNVYLGRGVTTGAPLTFYDQPVALTTGWQDYSITFSAKDDGRAGTLGLKFILHGASVLLDDVALTAAASSNNPTVYRDEVVTALKNLRPGTLRFMDSGTDWGSSLDNMLADQFARERTGYSDWYSSSDQVPMGLHDFLVLCQAIGAEPFYTMQTGMSMQEVSNLMDYLGGSTSTVYGAKRASLGQTAPWTSVFKTIHLEYGNEVWNTANPGAGMNNPIDYGSRVNTVFAKAKASPSYSSKSFDLIADGWEGVPYWNQAVLAAGSNVDTIDVATYIFASFNDGSTTEKTFGPMFAEPEALNSVSTGLMSQHAAIAAAAAHPANLAVYESNISSGNGSATQAQINASVPSVGAGITATDNMLLAMRDLGVNDQNMFALTGYQYGFQATGGSNATTSPIWGAVVDMGGQSNLMRPNFLSEQLANSAILPTLLSTSQTGANPTWNQLLSTNDDVVLPNAHYIQSFAFTDGTKLNVILINFSRTTALPVTFAGVNAPIGSATISTLTAPSITANNENGEQVAITSSSQNIAAGSTLTLQPFSMTVVSVGAPVVPLAVTSVSVSCARSALSPGDSTTCTSSVAGTGKYDSAITWSANQGTISSNGAYSAPATVPANGTATVTATSVQDPTKSASFTFALAANQITSVTASCSLISLGQGATTGCTAKVSGTGSFSSAYTWSISGGSISSTGAVTAPIIGTSVVVKATSTQDPTKSASVTISLFPVLAIGTPTITTTGTSMTVSWTTSQLARNGVEYGTTGALGSSTPYDNAFTTKPSYTITGLTPNTTYYVGLSSYNATQVAEKRMSVVTTATPASAIRSVSVACKTLSVLQGGTTSCTAPVQGTGAFSTAVKWSATAGTVDTSGNVTAPVTGTAVVVKATSVQDPTKSGASTITLMPALAISNPVFTVTGTTITASWTTNQATRNGVEWGLTYAMGSGTPYDNNFTTSPKYTLTGLKPGTTYWIGLSSYNDKGDAEKRVQVTTASK